MNNKAYYLTGSFSSSNARGFSTGAPVFPYPKKNDISNFNSDLKINARSLLNNFSINLKCFTEKLQFQFSLLYQIC